MGWAGMPGRAVAPARRVVGWIIGPVMDPSLKLKDPLVIIGPGGPRA
jgi:hypothetical protein